MSPGIAWILLVVAGVFETCWAVSLPYTNGFTRVGPSIFTLVTLAISMGLLAKATTVLPIGTAYGVWVGIGALGAIVFGVLVHHDPVTPFRLLFIALLLAGIIGLKATS